MARTVLVEIPDAYAGLLLARRLAWVAPDARVEGVPGDAWLVFSLEQRQVPRALRFVQDWLEEIHVRAARVRLGERECLLEA